MMGDKNICPENRSPIHLVDVEAFIKKTPKDKKPIKYKCRNIVLKGTVQEIKSNDQTKRQILKVIYKWKTNEKKFINEFDTSLIHIINVSLVKFIGHGIKSY
jgi:hypothetical protein